MNSRHSPIPSHTSVVNQSNIFTLLYCFYSSTNETSLFGGCSTNQTRLLSPSFVASEQLPKMAPQHSSSSVSTIVLFFRKIPQCSVTEPNHAKHTYIPRCLRILQCQALSVRSVVGGTVAHEVFFQLQQLDWVWSENSIS